MAKYENQINYKISTTYDNKGIQQLMNNLTAVQQKINNLGTLGLDADKVTAYNKEINKMNGAILSATDSFGKIDGKKLNKALTDANFNAKTFGAALEAAGSSGVGAATSIMGGLNKINTSMKQTSVMAQKIMNTLGNTVRWGLIATAFQAVLSNIQKAASYVKELDESLTQITMVSGESRDNMKEFAAYANQTARILGSATTDYTNAVKVFIQEGFNLQESVRQATQATILGNVSEQDTATTADQITAYRNAFQLSIADMDKSLDKLANIANKTAANVNELMVAAQKSASTAASVGASEDSFLASIATIQSVTREAAENIGNGLKSIYTRLADVKMGKTTEDGVGYGQYSAALKSAGVDILDSAGNVKTMDQILTELQRVWKTLDDSKKLAVGEKVAGRFQYNRFAALMNNAEYYEKAFAATQNADGAMNQMQADYMQGIEAMTQRISSNFEAIFTALYNSGALEGVVKLFTNLSDILGKIADIGGNASFVAALSGITALIAKLGKTAISENVANMIINRRGRNAIGTTQQITMESLFGQEYATKLEDNPAIKSMVNSLQGVNQYQGAYSQEQLQKVSKIQDELIAKSARYAENQAFINEKTSQLVKLTKELGVEEEVFDASVKQLATDIAKAEQAQKRLEKAASKTNLKNMDAAYNELQNNAAVQQYGSIEKAKEALKNLQQDNGKNNLSRIYTALTTDISVKDFAAQMKLMYGEVGNIAESAFEKISKGEKLTTEATDQLKKELQTITSESKLFSDSTKEIASDVLTKLQKGLDLTTEETERLKNALIQDREAFQQLEGILPKNIKQLIELARQSGFAENEIKQLTQALAGMAEQGKLQASIGRTTSLIGTLGSSMMNIVMVWSALKEALEAWGDEEKTFGEKIEATFMPLSMLLISLPMLMSEITNLKKIIKEITSARAAAIAIATAENTRNLEELATTAALTLSTEKNTQEKIKNATATLIQSKEFQKLSYEQKKSQLITALSGKGIQRETAAKQADIIITKMSKKALDNETASILRNTAARALAHPVITATIASLTLLIAIFAGIYAAATKEERALERQEKQLQKLTEATEHAEQISSEFNSALEKIESHNETFKNLIKGTKEYNKAITEADKNTLEFINTYGELLKDFSGDIFITDKFGALSLTEEAKLFLQKAIQLQENAAILAEESALIRKEELQSGINIKELANKTRKGSYVSQDKAEVVITDLVKKLANGELLLSQLKDVDFLKEYGIGSGNKEFFENIMEASSELSYFAQEIKRSTETQAKYTQTIGKSIISNSNIDVEENTFESDFLAAYMGQILTENAVNPYYTQQEYDFNIVDVINAILSGENPFAKTYTHSVQNGYGNENFFITDKQIEHYAKILGYTGNINQGFKDINGNEIDLQALINQAYKYFYTQSDQITKDAEQALATYKEIIDTFDNSNDVDTIIKTILKEGSIDVVDLITEGASFSGLQELYNLATTDTDEARESLRKLGLSADTVIQAFNLISESDFFDLETGKLKEGEEFATAINSYLDQYNVSGIGEIWQEFKLSPEDQIKLLGLINWEASPQEISEQLEKYSTPEAIKAALETTLSGEELALSWGGDAKEVEEYADYIQEVATSVNGLSDALESNRDLALSTANAAMRYSKAIDTIVEKQEDWAKVIKDAQKGSYKYAKTIEEIRETFNNLLDVKDFKFDVKFIEDQFSLLDKIAEKDQQAIIDLRLAAGQEIIKDITKHMQFGTDKLPMYYQTMFDNIGGIIQKAYEKYGDLDTFAEKFNITDLTDEYIGQLNELLRIGAVTQEQLTDLFASFGVGLDFEVTDEVVKRKVPVMAYYTKHPTSDVEGWEKRVEYAVQEGTTEVPLSVPKITSANGRSNSISYNPGKTSGGGGGSKKPKTYEYDRYERVNNQLDLNKSRQDYLTRNQERVSGKELIDNLLQQNELIQEQIDLEKEKNKIREGEIDEVRQALSNYGVQFDEDGIITNWKQIVDKMNREAAIHVNDEDYIEYLDKIQKYYERYNALDDERIGALKEISDLENQIQDKLIESFKAAADIATTYKELKDNLRQVEDSWAHLVGEDTPLYKMRKAFEDINYLIHDNTNLSKEMGKAFANAADEFAKQGNGPGQMLAQAFSDELMNSDSPLKLAATWQKMIQDGFKELQTDGSWSFFGTTFTNDDFQSIQELFSWINDYLNEMLSTLNDAIDQEFELFQDEVDRMTEAFDRQSDALDHINDNIDYYGEVMEAIYGDNAIDQLIALDKQKIENINTSLNLYNQQMAQDQRIIQELEAARGNYEEGSEQWLQIMDQIHDKQDEIVDLQDKYNDALKEQLELLKDIADKQVRSDTRNFLSNIIPDYEYNFKNWELLNENEEDWLDLGNRAYELQKLNNRYTEALDNAASPAAQKKINDLMQDELKMLREKDKLSQYDIDYANAKLDLLEKQLALEDAQMNKQTMRLRRDSQGNYSYVYSANEDEIKKAQEDALNAWNELYNLARDRSTEIKEEAISAAQEFEDKMAEIANNLNLSAEQRAALTEVALENFKDKMQYITDQSRKNMGDLTEAIEHDSEKIGLTLENAGAFNYIQSLGEITTAYLPAVQQWVDTLGAYADNPEELTNDLFNKVTETIYGLDAALQESQVKINDAIGGPEGIQTNIDNARIATEQLADEWNDEKWNNIGFAENLKKILDLIKQIKEEAPGLAENLQLGTDYLTDETSANKKYQTDSLVNNQKINLAKEYSAAAQNYEPGSEQWNDLMLKMQQLLAEIDTYDTGGYTGTWTTGIPGTDNGRFAILHQKELVLNEDQTKDILAAAQLVKSMTTALQNSVFSNIASGLGSVFAKSDFSQPIEQSVVINADFPAAESAAEIRMALEDLSNQASMYAFRTR